MFPDTVVFACCYESCIFIHIKALSCVLLNEFSSLVDKGELTLPSFRKTTHLVEDGKVINPPAETQRVDRANLVDKPLNLEMAATSHSVRSIGLIGVKF